MVVIEIFTQFVFPIAAIIFIAAIIAFPIKALILVIIRKRHQKKYGG